MTLDEAIEREENLAYSYGERYKRGGEPVGDLPKLEQEHRQMAEWLRVLKEIWSSGDCNDCRNGQCEWKPKLGQLVRFNCPHYVGIANKEVKVDDT